MEGIMNTTTDTICGKPDLSPDSEHICGMSRGHVGPCGDRLEHVTISDDKWEAMLAVEAAVNDNVDAARALSALESLLKDADPKLALHVKDAISRVKVIKMLTNNRQMVAERNLKATS